MEKLSIEMIQKWFRHRDFRVRKAAMNACQGREVPLEFIQQGLRDDDYNVREAALCTCERREVPFGIIQQWLQDDDFDVKATAMEVRKENGIEVPLIRTFEPPELVYKQCVDDVIVVAHIPEDAQIRGASGSKCRTDKAEIVDVIGDVCGQLPRPTANALEVGACNCPVV